MTPHLNIVQANSYDMLREILCIPSLTVQWKRSGVATLSFGDHYMLSVGNASIATRPKRSYEKQRMLDAMNQMYSVEKCCSWSYYC
jgi:hypothetical protein